MGFIHPIRSTVLPTRLYLFIAICVKETLA
jgi:hypothetical protein